MFAAHDLLVLHVDADVAAAGYADANIDPAPTDAPLPCETPCPPAVHSADAMRRALLSWGLETETPPRVVLCVPSKSTEAWIVAALFANDAAVTAGGFECHRQPASRLAQQPKKARMKKRVSDYRSREKDLESAWPTLMTSLSQAGRFGQEIRDIVAGLDVH